MNEPRRGLRGRGQISVCMMYAHTYIHTIYFTIHVVGIWSCLGRSVPFD